MNKLTVLIVFIISSVTFSQVTTSGVYVEFAQTTVGITVSVPVYLINTGTKAVSINKVYKSSALFVVSDSVFSIPSDDSINIVISYKPKENIIDHDVITFMNSDSSIAVSIRVQGSGKYNDVYDAITFNKFDAELKSALTTYTSGHTSLGYNAARDRMFETVDDYGNDTIECVYIGRRIKAVTRTEAQNQNFNTEHTWPQSNFSSNEPMQSDLYHLFPTDATPNSARANYPFGYVVSNITYNVGGSKLGRDASGSLVFEVRDIHKGNVARSMFYFLTRYPSNYGSFFSTAQESVFRQWNAFDTVEFKERLRNDRIALYQVKRNPFIDHPEFADRIYSFLTTASHPIQASLNIYPVYGSFDTTTVNDSTLKPVYLVNYGNADLVIDSISISNDKFKLAAPPAFVQKYSYAALNIYFKPDSNLIYEGDLTVYTSLGVKNISLKGIGSMDSLTYMSDASYPVNYTLMQNYPNPFNPSTTISFNLPVQENVTLKLYDILGNEVAVLFNSEAKAGINNINFNASHLSSGIYIYVLRTGNFTSSKVMSLIK